MLKAVGNKGRGRELESIIIDICVGVGTSGILALIGLVGNTLWRFRRIPARIDAMDASREMARAGAIEKDKVVFRSLLAIGEALEGNCNGNITSMKKELSDYLIDEKVKEVV